MYHVKDKGRIDMDINFNNAITKNEFFERLNFAMERDQQRVEIKLNNEGLIDYIRSGHPIDSIKQGDPDALTPAQENRTHAYQSLDDCRRGPGGERRGSRCEDRQR